LSHHPELSGHAVHGKVYGLEIGGQHSRRFVILRHTHKPQRGPYLICTTGAEAVKPDPDSSWEGQSMGVGAGVRDESAESCGIVHHTACHW